MTPVDVIPRVHVVEVAPDVLIASSTAATVAAQLGFTPQECAEIVLVARELATNILRHAMTAPAWPAPGPPNATDFRPPAASDTGWALSTVSWTT